MAEAVGLSEELDLAVLQRAIAAMRQTGASVAVNVSGRSIVAPRFIERLLGLIVGLPPWRLLIEITETAEIEDLAAASLQVGRLRAARIGVCLDDFGAGSASFRYVRDLKVDYLYQGAHFKTEALAKIASAEAVGMEEIAYVGDDIIDLPPMRQVGFAVATWNAREQVKREAHWVTPHAGGLGAGRDVIDFVLESQGRLDEAIAFYLSKENKSPDIGSGGM